MLKTKLRSKFGLQAALEIVFLIVYIWVVEIKTPQWFRSVFLWGVCVAYPIFCIAKDQRSFPEFSLDWRAFLRCLRTLVWFTTGATALLIGISLYYRTFNYDDQFLQRMSEYFFWAFLQQIGLQTFLTYRVSKVFQNPVHAALVSAFIFGALHFPNMSLVIFSGLGGFFWAYSYIQTPNLYAIAVSHGWLAVTALHCLPRPWLHNLRIGPTYWTF